MITKNEFVDFHVYSFHVVKFFLVNLCHWHTIGFEGDWVYITNLQVGRALPSAQGQVLPHAPQLFTSVFTFFSHPSFQSPLQFFHPDWHTGLHLPLLQLVVL
jgi:hypothetical protein